MDLVHACVCGLKYIPTCNSSSLIFDLKKQTDYNMIVKTAPQQDITAFAMILLAFFNSLMMTTNDNRLSKSSHMLAKY